MIRLELFIMVVGIQNVFVILTLIWDLFFQIWYLYTNNLLN